MAEVLYLTHRSLAVSMRLHRINRNFTTAEAIQLLILFPSSFEQVVKALNISPEEYESSLELKEWVRGNKDHKHVPTGLLEAFGGPHPSSDLLYIPPR